MAEVDRAQLMRYIEIEKKIQSCEGGDTVKKYDEMVTQMDDIKQTIKTMEIDVTQLELKTKKEKKDVDDITRESQIKNMFQDEKVQQQLSREQEEYLEALNKEEVTKQNLAGLRKQLAEYEKNAAKLEAPAKQIKVLFEERDNLLSDIFNGEYGSELENKLEAEFDNLMDRKQRVSVAHYKWINARVLLQHAVNQLSYAVKKWNEIYPNSQPQMRGQMQGQMQQATMMRSPLNPQAIYQITTEVRNNLVAAHQNVNSCQSYLKTITFPYCVPLEMETLNRAIVNIYTDSNCCDRHRHASDCYTVTYKRAAALIQWFDTVINDTIQKDLKQVTVEARQLETKLRAERVRLIRAKVEESGGNVGDLNDSGLMGQSDQQQTKNSDTEELGVFKPEKVSDNNSPDAKMQSMQIDDREPCPPTPIPLNRLAPPPSQDEIFGNISKIKTEHEKNTQEFQKAQDLNKARLEQNLQTKLEARRHKKKM